MWLALVEVKVGVRGLRKLTNTFFLVLPVRACVLESAVSPEARFGRSC